MRREVDRDLPAQRCRKRHSIQSWANFSDYVGRKLKSDWYRRSNCVGFNGYTEVAGSPVRFSGQTMYWPVVLGC